MLKTLVDLWNGQIPLGTAFWRFAVLYGAIANLLAFLAVLIALANDASAPLVLFLHVLPAPYWFAASLGVWRSADRYEGPAHWASRARVAAVAWLLFMLVV